MVNIILLYNIIYISYNNTLACVHGRAWLRSLQLSYRGWKFVRLAPKSAWGHTGERERERERERESVRAHSTALIHAPPHTLSPPPLFHGAAGERIGPAGATEPGRRRRPRRAGSTCALGVRGGGGAEGLLDIYLQMERDIYIYIHVRRLYIKYFMS